MSDQRGHLRVVHGSDDQHQAHLRRIDRARAQQRSEFAVSPGSSLTDLDGVTIRGREDGSAEVRPEQFGPDGRSFLVLHCVPMGSVMQIEPHEVAQRSRAATGYRVGPRALLLGGDSLPPGTPVDPAAVDDDTLSHLIRRGLILRDDPAPDGGPEAA